MYVRRIKDIVRMSENEFNKLDKFYRTLYRHSDKLVDLLDVIVFSYLRPTIAKVTPKEYLAKLKSDYADTMSEIEPSVEPELKKGVFGAIVHNMGITYVARVYEDGSVELI